MSTAQVALDSLLDVAHQRHHRTGIAAGDIVGLQLGDGGAVTVAPLGAAEGESDAVPVPPGMVIVEPIAHPVPALTTVTPVGGSFIVACATARVPLLRAIETIASS